MKRPRNPSSTRPYRIWHAEYRKNLPGRNYTVLRNAHNSALAECRWARVGLTLEVYDVRNGRLMGQYTRKVDTVSFRGA